MMTELCGRCKEQLPAEGELDYATCCVCNNGYHFNCTTVGETSWRTMGDTRRGSWKCPTCRDSTAKNNKGPGNNTPDPKEQQSIKQKEQQTKGGSSSSTTEPKKDQASGKSEDVCKMIENLTKKITTMETTINAKLGEFADSLTFYGGRIEELAVSLKNVEKKNILLEKRLDTQDAENKELKTRVKQLEGLLHQRDQNDLTNKMEISGFKDVNIDENQFVKKVIQATGLDDDIQFRVEKIVKDNKETGKTQSLVVHFKTENARNIVLSKIKEGKIYNKAGSFVQCNTPTKLFFNECLTPYYKKLFYEAKKVKIDKKYAFLWVKSGKILLKKQAESRIETLISMEDLKKM
uniref:PHD-type domain-containing protein n=1 Tax=Cacopsylla melanoneura TaxID=428564 RepID=A0A8D8QDK5_9HEMI